MPFRESHGIVAGLVRDALDRGKQLSELDARRARGALARARRRVLRAALANGAWLESKVSEGGTALAARAGAARAGPGRPRRVPTRRASTSAVSSRSPRTCVGCVLRHGETAGVIVEIEAYHESEPACHAHVGLTGRTRILFGPPARAYVYRSYGIHALLNAVTEAEGVGAAVLIRALEPLEGLELMRERRGVTRAGATSATGPGKLTQALDIELDLNGSDLLGGPIAIEPPRPGGRRRSCVVGPRIGITKAAELPWRFCAAGSRSVSRPWPKGLRDTLAPRI